MDKIKVMFFVQDLDTEGGAEKYILTLIDQLDYKKIDLSVLHFGSKNKSIKQLKKSGYKVGIIKSRAFTISNIIKIKKIVNNYKPDIIHSHMFKSDLFAYIISLISKDIIYISTKYSTFTRSIKKNTWFERNITKPIMDKYLEKMLSNRCDHIIAVSKAVKNYLQGLGIKSPISIIEDAYLSRNSLKIRSKSDFYKCFPQGRNQICIGTTCRFVPEKGIEYLIDAFFKLQKDIPNVHLFLAGDGHLKEIYIKRVKKLDIEDKITFLGYITNIDTFLSGLDIYVLPSLTDAFPLSIQEAMLLERNIIATNVGGIPELIESKKEGVLVKSRSAKEIKDAMKMLIEKKISFGKNAKKKILNNFTIDISSKKIKYLYHYLTITKRRNEEIKNINPLKMTKQDYNKLYRNYEDLREIGEYDPIMREFERTKIILSKIPKRSKVLDIGCNSGGMGLYIKNVGCDVYGVDISKNLVSEAKRKGIKAILSNAEELPFHNNNFDAVVMGEIIEHVLDVKSFMKEAMRVLKMGGVIVGSTPHENGRWGLHTIGICKEHIRCFTKSTLKGFLKKHFISDIGITTLTLKGEKNPDFYIFWGRK